MKTKNQGFSILELLVALSIAAILLVLASPSFSSLIANTRISTSANNFVSSLQIAKIESVARATTITLCVRNPDGDGCLMPAPSNWQPGWIIFEDKDSDKFVDAGESVLHISEPLASKLTLKATPSITNAITYNSSGMLEGITAIQTFILCDDRGFIDRAKGVVVTMTGRGSVLSASQTGETTCL